jgi:hypothetical protein
MAAMTRRGQTPHPAGRNHPRQPPPEGQRRKDLPEARSIVDSENREKKILLGKFDRDMPRAQAVIHLFIQHVLSALKSIEEEVS